MSLLRLFFPKSAEEGLELSVRKMVPFLFYMDIVLVFYFLLAIFAFTTFSTTTPIYFNITVLTTTSLFFVSIFLIKAKKYTLASVVGTGALFLNSLWTGTLLPLRDASDITLFTVYLIGASVGNSMVSIRKRQIIIYAILVILSLTLVTVFIYAPAFGGFKGRVLSVFSVMTVLMVAVNAVLILTSNLHHSLISELKGYSENLEDMVEKRTKELNEANGELTKKHLEISQNLKLAQRIQHNILPNEKSYPQREELDFGSQYHSLDAVGGDLFDIIRVGRNSYGFLMADVSGHGIPAAMITTMAKVSFNSHAEYGTDTGEICGQVNQDIFRLTGGEMNHFVTAFFGVLNLETGKFQYTNAGHHPAIHFNSHEQGFRKLSNQSPFLGFFETNQYTSEETTIVPGDRLLFFTDGIVEAMNGERQQYDYPKLETFLEKNYRLPAREFVNNLLEDVQGFAEGVPPDDVMAILLVDYLGTMEVHVEKIQAVSPTQPDLDELLKEVAQKYREKDMKAALKILEPLYKSHPKKFKVLKFLATVLYMAGDFARSKTIVSEALTIKPDDDELLKLNEAVRKNLGD